MIRRILPFPRRPLKVTKVWNDDEIKSDTLDPIDEAAAIIAKDEPPTAENLERLAKLLGSS